jgi:hypothetical protein
MFNFLKNVKKLSIVAVSSNFSWLIDNRNAIKNIEKIVVLTPPTIQRELKKKYKGSDVYFKYVDEMKEVAQICDCVMFINANHAFIDEYMKYASHYGNLNFVILPKGSGKMFKKISNVAINGYEYEIFNIKEPIEIKNVEAVELPKTEKIVEVIKKTSAPVAETLKETTIKSSEKEISIEPIAKKKPFGKGRR